MAVCIVYNWDALIFLFSLIAPKNHMILTDLILNSYYIFIEIWWNVWWNNLSLFRLNFLSSFSSKWSIFMLIYWIYFIEALISLILKFNYSFLVIYSKLQFKIIYIFSSLNEILFSQIIIFRNFSIYSFHMFLTYFLRINNLFYVLNIAIQGRKRYSTSQIYV